MMTQRQIEVIETLDLLYRAQYHLMCHGEDLTDSQAYWILEDAKHEVQRSN